MLSVKKTIYPLVDTIYNLYQQLHIMQTAFIDSTAAELPTTEEISALQTDYDNLLYLVHPTPVMDHQLYYYFSKLSKNSLLH